MDEPSEFPEAEEKKSGGKWMLPLGALLLAGAAGAAVFVFDVPGRFAPPAEAHAEEKPAKKKPAYVTELDAFVVSLQGAPSGNRLPRLRFVVAVETPGELEDKTLVYRLRNEILSAVQDLDSTALRGPDGLDVLRDAITRQTEEVLGDETGRVLITDFILL